MYSCILHARQEACKAGFLPAPMCRPFDALSLLMCLPGLLEDRCGKCCTAHILQILPLRHT